MMDRAFGNKIDVDSIAGAAITGSIVNIRSWNYAGMPPPTADNFVDVRASAVASQGAYVTIQGRDTIRNHVLRGKFSGHIQNQAAQSFRIIDAGPGNVLETADGRGTRQE
jgi:hypothetical protein